MGDDIVAPPSHYSRPAISSNVGNWLEGDAFADVFVGEAGTFKRLNTRRVEIHQEEFTHEVGVFYLDRTAANFKLACLNAPVVITYGRLPLTHRTMVGYVSHIEPSSEAGRSDAKEQYVVYAVGPTRRTSQPYAQSWENATTAQIVRDLAQRHFFAADVMDADETNFLWTSAVMTLAETQWEFLVKVCKGSGHTLVPRGTTLHVSWRNSLRWHKNITPERYRKAYAIKVEMNPSDRPARDWVDPKPVETPQGVSVEDKTPPVPAPVDDLLLQICRPEGGPYDTSARDPDSPFGPGIGIGFPRPIYDISARSPGTQFGPVVGLGYERSGFENPLTEVAPDEGVLEPANQQDAYYAARRMEEFQMKVSCNIIHASARVQAGGVIWLGEDNVRTVWSGYHYVIGVKHIFVGGDTGNKPTYWQHLRLGDRDLPNSRRGGRPHHGTDNRTTIQVPEGEEGGGSGGGGGGGGGGGAGRRGRRRRRPLTARPRLVTTRPPVYRPVPTPGNPNPGGPKDPGAVNPTPPPTSQSPLLNGPTCPIQPQPFLPAEWRSPFPATVEDL